MTGKLIPFPTAPCSTDPEWQQKDYHTVGDFLGRVPGESLLAAARRHAFKLSVSGPHAAKARMQRTVAKVIVDGPGTPWERIAGAAAIVRKEWP